MFTKVAAIIMLAASMSMAPEGTVVYNSSTSEVDCYITKMEDNKYELVANYKEEGITTEGFFETGERAVTNGYWAIRTIGKAEFEN